MSCSCFSALLVVVSCYVRPLMTSVRRWLLLTFFFFKQETAYEMRISDWSSDVCSSDLPGAGGEFHELGVRLPHIFDAEAEDAVAEQEDADQQDRKSTRLNSSH